MIKITKDFILRILLLCLPVIAIIQYWFYGNTQIEQLCLVMECTIMCTLLCFTFRQTMTYKIAVTLILCVFSIIITLSYHKGLGSGIILISLLLGTCVFNNLSVSLSTYRWLHIIAALLLLGFALTLNYNSTYYVSSKYTNIMINPNVVGGIWLVFILHFFCFIKTFKQNLFLHILNIAMITMSAYFIHWSGCRSALGSLFMFLALLFFKEKPFSIKTYHYLVRVVLLMSMLFVIVYLIGHSHFANTQLLGKGLFSGRQFVWKTGLELIFEYPFFGSGNDFMYEAVKAQTASSHNMMLGLWKMFGIIPSIAVIFLLTSTHTLNCQARVEKIPQFAFVASLFVGFTEALLIGPHYIFFLLFLICLVNPNESESAEQE